MGTKRDAMVAYVLFVAIVNFLLGFGVAALLLPTRLRRRLRGVRRRLGQWTPAGASASLLRGPQSAFDPPSEKPAGGSGAKSSPVAVAPLVTPQNSRPPALNRRWNSQVENAAEELRDIRDRVRYCQSTRDSRLLKEAADRLRSWARTRVESLSQQLESAEMVPDSESQSIALEMYASQVETSLNNIQMLDWSDGADAVATQLEREIELLDQPQPLGILDRLQRRTSLSAV